MTRLVFLILTGLCLTFSVAHAQQVKFVTSMGDITVEVDPVKAPITTENFLRYVRDGFYDGTLFHRVINGFVLQGGGFNEAFEQKPTRPPILNEANNLVKNRRGTLSMARTSDPHSATAQYFINVVDNPFLDHSAKTQSGWGYAVFAKVIDGMDVIDQIKEVATGNFGFYQNVPITPVVVISATILIPPAPYVQSDLEGHWNLIHFGDDARTPNSPWAESCEFDFAASGTLNAGACTDTNGVLETFKRKAFKALISEFGEVNFNDPLEDNITLADAQMDLGRTVIARIAAIDETDTLAERILEVFVAQGAGYLQSDLNGTWHLFQYGDEVTLGSNAPSWKAGSITLNTLGTITQGAFSKDDDPLTLVNVASGSAILDDHGVVSATGNWVSDAVLLDERLDSGMSVIAGVARETFVDPKSNDNLRIWVKQGHRYSQNDASGFWYLYVFSDQSPGIGDPENIPDVSKYFISVSNTGELSGNGFASDQQAFQLQGQMLVDDEGGVTFTGNIGSEFLFHKLQMDAGKTVVAGVANKDDQSTYRPALIMAVKSAAPAKIISPITGATLEETIQTFDWVDNGNDINLSRIYVGTRPGTKDLFDSGNLDESIRTVIAPGLPNDGRPVYVRLRYRVAKVWKYSDSQYLSANIANVQPPSLLAPLPGSLLAPSLDQATQFQWATNGTSVRLWQLLLGDTPGASNIHNSGTLGGATLTTPVLGLPADGRTLHARLRYFDRAWKHVDVQYRLPDNPFPSLTSPSQGSTFTESEVTFQWSLNDHPVQDTELWVGSKVGGKEFANLRGLGNSITTVNVGKLPSDGRGIFVRLRYRIFGKWAWADYSFKASDTPLPALTNPTPGTVLSGANVTFNWNNAQHAVTDTQLLVGTRAGRGDLANSRSLGAGVTSFDVQGLPADGRSIYVRLRSRIAGKWLNADYTFTANNFVLPELTAPNAGATLADSELFTWDHKGHPVQDTELWVGTGFAGKQIAYHRKLGTLTEQQVENLPTSGQPVYVRLRSKILGKWNYKDYQFKASGDPLPTLTSPAPGSSLSSAEVTFDWDLSGLVVQDTQLLVGNKPGASNLGKSALLGVVENASYTATGLPADGRLVYVRLRYRLAGKWKHHDYTFTAADLALPALIFPAPVENPAKLTGADVTFIWDHNEHQVTDAQLLIGSRIGRSEFANSRSLGAGVNSFDAQGLPTDGRTLYVRLRSRINGKWANADYTFPAASFPAPTLISPTQGATLGNTTQTFQWDFKGHPIQDTELSVGTSLGGKQIINQRKLGTATEFLVADLPANGRPLYVRLRTRILGKWLFKDYQFKASGGGDEPTLNSPALGTILTGAEVSFDWDMNGLSVEDTQLLLGSKPGASDLARSDFLGAVETASFTATTLPADGRRVFVRLRYRLAGKWKNLDYVYSAANFPVPSITSQSAIDALTTFNWDSNGHAVSDYQVLIGSRKGLGDLAKSKLLDSATSTFEAPLPTDGRSISVRLRSRIGGKWFNSDSSFNALTLDQPGLTSPALGESINSQTVNFQWSFNGHHVQDSELWVGSSFSGKQIAIATGLGGNTTEFQVDNIPANARTVYIRLRYLSFGKWLYSDYVVPVELLGDPG